MKNISLYMLALLTLFMVSCEPNKELYEQLDAVEVPDSKTIDYTFTATDYTDFAKQVKQYYTTDDAAADAKNMETILSFAPDRTIDSYPLAIKSFFKTKFPGLDETSTVKITTDYSETSLLRTTKIIPTDANFDHYVITNADYAAMGGTVALKKRIKNSTMPTLIAYIQSTIFPTAVSGNNIVLTYAYEESETPLVFYTKESFFTFNGVMWTEDVTKVTPSKAEYYAIGANTGIGYFSSTFVAQNYLPLYLNEKFPYAQPKDVKTVLYRYKVNDTLTYVYADNLTFDGVNWSEKNPKTENIYHSPDGWVYDITIRFTMQAADYQILADWTSNNFPSYFNTVYKNEEYHFGASAYYRNFNLKLSTRRGKDVDGLLPTDNTEALAFMEQKVIEGVKLMLETKYPEAQPVMSSMELFAEVTYMVYYGTNPSPYFKTRFKCTETGKFEPIEENPTVQVK